MPSRLCLFLALILAVTFSPSILLADGSQTGTVDGSVVGADGEVLPGVTVTLAGPQGQQTTTTGQDGQFRFNGVPPGEYAIGASLEGLGSDEIEAVMTAGQRLSLSLQLRGSSTAEAITVTAEAPLVDKFTVGSSAALEAAVAENLSFKGRNYQSSLEALPSVVHDGQSRLTGDIQPAVNGGQHTEIAAFVDGVDTSFSRFGGSPRLFLPTSVLTEARLESAGFSVEYGRAVSGISNAVVKSGTNTFHGSFLWIPQNKKWRAEYEALDIPREDDIINSFETSIGGPIVRDKAWFFAAYADQDTNESDQLADGGIVDAGFKNEVSVLKLNFQPTSRHYLSLLGVDSPVEKVQINQNSGDRYTPCACDLPAEILTATWGFSISSSLFLEAKGAAQQNDVLRDPLLQREVVPGANPHSPIGNQFPYIDRNNNITYNQITQNIGYLKVPRDQGNMSLSVFAGENELKFGADYQDIEMQSLNVIGQRFNGLGYNETRVGGFTTPQFMDVFDPSGQTATTSEILSFYAQDRVTFGGRWTLTGGLRYDDQALNNDIGQEVVTVGELTPRVAAVYDVKENGRLLLKANAGRYLQTFTQDTASREFSQLPTGTNYFNRFNWNPATQRYDVFVRRNTPAANAAISDIDPYYKDEATVGLEWQFAESWAFEGQAIWWELSDLFLFTDQFNAAGQVYRDVRNWDDDAFREYRGVRLEANRAFRNNWTLRANYTIGKNNGNNFGNNSSALDNDDLFDALGGVEVCTAASYAGCVPGTTNATTRNREGRGPFDRKHNFNLVGLKQFELGTHHLGVGAYFGYRSGERWGNRPSTTIQHPVSRQPIATSTYRTPRDANQMEDTFNLNLTGTWTFPIRGAVQGRVGVEAANVTNEQEIISYNVTAGTPSPGKFGIQTPREIRFQAGITF
jgi:outer membrane receptor protein involved in Fe transport